MPGQKSAGDEAEEKSIALLGERLKGMRSHLEKLRMAKYCDVALKTIPNVTSSDEKSVYGHKIILGAASPYLKNLFSSDSGGRQYSIEGMDKATLELLLDCIYTSNVVPIDEKNMFGICRGAKILQLPDIQAACERFIDKSRKIDNCLEIWLFGKKEECTSLTDTSFIIQHFLNVANLAQFTLLTSEELRGLMSTCFTVSTDDKLGILYKWLLNGIEDEKKKSRIESFLFLVRDLPQNEISYKVFATVFIDDRLLYEDIECQKFRSTFLLEFFLNHSEKNDTPALSPSKVTTPKATSQLGTKEGQNDMSTSSVGSSSTKSSRRRPAPVRSNGLNSTNETTQKRKKSVPSSSSDTNGLTFIGGPCVAYYLSTSKAGTSIKSMDFQTGDIETVAKFSKYRPNGVLLLSNNWLYYFGGWEDDDDSEKIDVFDMGTREWKDNDDLLVLDEGRCYFNAAVLGDFIYVVAGYRDDACIDSVERIPVGQLATRPLAEGEEEVTNVRWPKNRAPLAILDGKMYSIAGAVAEESHEAWASAFVERYDPTTNEWSDIKIMPTPRVGHAAVALNSKLYVLGGGNSEQSNASQKFSTVEAYDPKTDTWETRASMMKKRHFLAAVATGGHIYAIGGDSVRKPTIERYDPLADTWTLLTITNIPADADFSSMIFKVDEIPQ